MLWYLAVIYGAGLLAPLFSPEGDDLALIFISIFIHIFLTQVCLILGGPALDLNFSTEVLNRRSSESFRSEGGYLSQFFICHSRTNTAHLDRNHTVFGKVYEGLDVIDQIEQGDVMDKVVIVDEE